MHSVNTFQRVNNLAEWVGYSDPAKLITAATFLVSCGANFRCEESKLVDQGMILTEHNNGFERPNFIGLRKLLLDITNCRQCSLERW